MTAKPKATTSTTWWWCMDETCGESGVFEQSNSGGAAEKHAKEYGHGTSTSLRGPKPEGWGSRWPWPRS